MLLWMAGATAEMTPNTVGDLKAQVQSAITAHRHPLYATGSGIYDGAVGCIYMGNKILYQNIFTGRAPSLELTYQPLGEPLLRHDNDCFRHFSGSHSSCEEGKSDPAAIRLITETAMQPIDHGIASVCVDTVAGRQVNQITTLGIRSTRLGVSYSS